MSSSVYFILVFILAQYLFQNSIYSIRIFIPVYLFHHNIYSVSISACKQPEVTATSILYKGKLTNTMDHVWHKLRLRLNYKKVSLWWTTYDTISNYLLMSDERKPSSPKMGTMGRSVALQSKVNLELIFWRIWRIWSSSSTESAEYRAHI